MKFKNGDVATIDQTSSDLDGMLVTIVGCLVISSRSGGTFYVVQHATDSSHYFEYVDGKWKTVILSESFLFRY